MIEHFSISEPFVFQIFGATGHLAKSKIYPALFELALQKRFPKEYMILGYGRTSLSREEFQDHVQSAISTENEPILTEFLDHIYYCTGDYDSVSEYTQCNDLITSVLGNDICPRVAYFAVPPLAFGDIAVTLGNSKRHADEDIRLIMEKPFGENTQSATDLYHTISQYFSDDQIFLLDHYLGKNAVQSILHLRHKNRILDILLRNEHIANIQITAFEQEGILNRAAYFEKMGTLKDMIQSHLLQLLALTTMSIPLTKCPESIHRERAAILEAFQFTPHPSNIISGQYASYTLEKDVPDNSPTETFIAARLHIDREHWHKIPLYIRTGKKMDKKETYIVVEFHKFSFQDKSEEPNRLIFTIYPDETLRLTFQNQYNSFEEMTNTITSDSSIACMGDDCLPEHGRLLLKVLAKDKTYFLSYPEIISNWKLAEAMLSQMPEHPISYDDSNGGPKEHLDLPAQDGYTWYDLP